MTDLRDQQFLRHLRQLFAYDAWANGEVLDRLPAASPPDRAVTLLAHIVAAHSLWLDRLHQRPQRRPVWPALDLERCRRGVEETAQEFRDFLNALDQPALAEPRTYVNSKGETHTTAVGDVLLHVLLHSAYHRGQIASAVRAAGSEPAYTDYVHAVRRGVVASPFEPA